MAAGAPPTHDADDVLFVRHHVRTGWILLALFGTLGLVLESLHGLKLQTYVGVDFSTRREMWTLAHAHGTLLGVVHLAFAFSLFILPNVVGKVRLSASRLLTVASVCMPVGFFLGGANFYEGDPGLGILLVPFGATCLIVCATLLAFSKRETSETPLERKTSKRSKKRRDR